MASSRNAKENMRATVDIAAPAAPRHSRRSNAHLAPWQSPTMDATPIPPLTAKGTQRAAVKLTHAAAKPQATSVTMPQDTAKDASSSASVLVLRGFGSTHLPQEQQ